MKVRGYIRVVLICMLTAWAGNPHLARAQTDEATALELRVRELRKAGKTEEAIPLARQALALREQALTPGHADVDRSLKSLAELYEVQGRYTEAEPLYKRLLLNLQDLGDRGPEVGYALNRLALVYRRQGRYAEAEPLYKRSAAVREKALGPDHPDVGESLNNLAELYRVQHRYADAEPLYERDLAIIEKALGPDHPDVATSLNNRALLHLALGRYAEAERLHKRSLAIREKALGREHSDVGQTLSNLADLYRIQGRFAEADPLYTSALAIREKALGPEHDKVSITLNNFGLHYDVQGRYAEAEKLYKRALAIREKAFGPDHPDVGETLNNLAKLYRKMGRADEAANLEARAGQMPPVGTRHIQVHFATNRKQVGTGAGPGSESFGADEADTLTLGQAVVRVPHKEVEQLAKRRDEGLGTPDRSRGELTNADQLKIVNVRSLKDPNAFATSAATSLSRAVLYKGQALLFIHGYNLSFEDALRRAGQIAFDLEFDGLLIPFTWPSKRRLTQYLSDTASADVAVDHLIKLLDILGQHLPPTRMHFIAHSMGNLVLLRALERISDRRAIGSKLTLGELILAHADIDARRCGQLIRNVRSVVAGITLYVHESDWALWSSEKLSRRTRCGAKARVYDGADTIDLTALKGALGDRGNWASGWNHDAFVRAPLVFGEITRLLLSSTRPPERRTPELVPVKNGEGETYWQMDKSRVVAIDRVQKQ